MHSNTISQTFQAQLGVFDAQARVSSVQVWGSSAQAQVFHIQELDFRAQLEVFDAQTRASSTKGGLHLPKPKLLTQADKSHAQMGDLCA